MAFTASLINNPLLFPPIPSYTQQAKNPTIIQAHLKKLFQGIHGVEFNEAETQITAMLSSDGEKASFVFNKYVRVTLRVLGNYRKGYIDDGEERGTKQMSHAEV